MELKKKVENANPTVVGIGFCVTIVMAVLFCILIARNQTRTISLKVDEFEVQEMQNTEVTLTSVTQGEKYLKVEGRYNGNLENYEIYVGLKKENGERKIYKTELQKEQNFYTLIPNEKVLDEAEIEIFDLCNQKKTLIKTGKKVGEIKHE